MKFQTVAVAFFSMLLAGTNLLAQQTDVQPQQNALAEAQPVLVQPVVFLAPVNSRISFVGIHVGDDPKPRLGGFSEFQGYAIADEAKNKIQSFVIDINVDSVWTQFEKLTGHLKNADFFDTEKFPTARFASTEITDAQEGQCTVTGDLTLHGATKLISFPADYRFENGGLVLAAKFQIDRSQFGMDQMLSGVDKSVEVEIVVGQKTSPSEAQPGHGGDSKKKQSSVKPGSDMQTVSINLPNMEWTGCEASVRSDLGAVEGTSNIKTDLDEKTCSFDVASDVDVNELLNALASENNKMSEWSFQTKEGIASQ